MEFDVNDMRQIMIQAFQIAISLFRTDFPWLYDAGLEVARKIRINASAEEKQEAVHAFFELADFTFDHPMMREMYMPDKEMWMFSREIPRLLKRTLERHL
jgi:hypothetical protein